MSFCKTSGRVPLVSSLIPRETPEGVSPAADLRSWIREGSQEWRVGSPPVKQTPSIHPLRFRKLSKISSRGKFGYFSGWRIKS